MTQTPAAFPPPPAETTGLAGVITWLFEVMMWLVARTAAGATGEEIGAEICAALRAFVAKWAAAQAAARALAGSSPTNLGRANGPRLSSGADEAAPRKVLGLNRAARSTVAHGGAAPAEDARSDSGQIVPTPPAFWPRSMRECQSVQGRGAAVTRLRGRAVIRSSAFAGGAWRPRPTAGPARILRARMITPSLV
jgi:hypothetical protein